MEKEQLLQSLYDGEVDAQSVYKTMYPQTFNQRGLKRAHFAKLRINAKDEGFWPNLLLRLLFILPFPVVFGRLILRVLKKKIDQTLDQHSNGSDLNYEMIYGLLKYSKGVRIDIQTDDADINIKVY